MLDSVRLGKLREATQAARQSNKKTLGSKAASPAAISDAASMSVVALHLNAMLQDAQAPVDAARVHDIQQAIANGSYKIDFDFLSEKLLNDSQF